MPVFHYMEVMLCSLPWKDVLQGYRKTGPDARDIIRTWELTRAAHRHVCSREYVFEETK